MIAALCSLVFRRQERAEARTKSLVAAWTKHERLRMQIATDPDPIRCAALREDLQEVQDELKKYGVKV